MLFHEERYALHELGSTAAEAGGVATVFDASAVLVSGSAAAPIGTVAAVEEEAEEASGGTPPPVAHMLFQVWKYSAQDCSAAGIWMDGEGDSKCCCRTRQKRRCHISGDEDETRRRDFAELYDTDCNVSHVSIIHNDRRGQDPPSMPWHTRERRGT